MLTCKSDYDPVNHRITKNYKIFFTIKRPFSSLLEFKQFVPLLNFSPLYFITARNNGDFLRLNLWRQ